MDDLISTLGESIKKVEDDYPSQRKIDSIGLKKDTFSVTKA